MILTIEGLLFAGMMFALRVINYAVGTVRLVFITRGKRVFAAALAFVEALIFAVVMASVVADLQNVLNLMAYCMGAAVGSYTGMVIEARLVTSYSTVQIITKQYGAQIAQLLREKGYGVTETTGRGRDGEVSILRTSLNNRHVSDVLTAVTQVDPKAFVEVEAASTIQRGWVPGMPHRSYRP
jgi:uncharacterized protein YebE (UPF0316 family)